MDLLLLLAATFLLLWVLFIRPQQRRVRAHQHLVSSLQIGDEVVLGAGIFGRITELGPEELALEIATGVEVKVARQAVLRRVETLPDSDDQERDVVGDDPDDLERTTIIDEPGTVDPDDERPSSGER